MDRARSVPRWIRKLANPGGTSTGAEMENTPPPSWRGRGGVDAGRGVSGWCPVLYMYFPPTMTLMMLPRLLETYGTAPP